MLRRLLLFCSSFPKPFSDEKAVNSVEHRCRYDETTGCQRALINEGACHRCNNRDRRGQFNAEMMKVGCLACSIDGVVQKLATIAFDKPIPSHLCVATGQAKKQPRIKTLNILHHRSYGKDLQGGSKDNYSRGDKSGCQCGP